MVLDTWQYFLHRAMHVNKFLYKHLHSVHHRLYVPYAYGALYNHPLEGFLLDTLGALLAEAGVNIATFNLGRVSAGEDAIALVGIDQEPTDDLLARIRALPHVKEARSLQF